MDVKISEKLPGYSLWRRNVSGKTKTEAQRKQIAEFTLRALEGEYDTVYLTEINRRLEGDELSSEFTSELIPDGRYGKISMKTYLRTKEVFCNSSEFLRDPKFASAKLVHGYHYHSDNDPSRKNVESDNIRQTFELAQRANKPIFHIRSLHSPVSKSSGLEKVSAKEIQGVSKDFLAFEGMPCKILSNMATQFGLYN